MKLFNLLTIIFFASIFFYSCGDDNITNSSNNNGTGQTYIQDSLVFEQDSLNAWSTDTLVRFAAGRHFDDTTSQGLRVTFTAATNTDSSEVSVGAGSFYNTIKTGAGQINGSFDLIIDTRGQSDFFLGCSSVVRSHLINPPQKYCKMFNIKVWRITFN